MANKRYYSLDIVRGFAALSVMLTHWSEWTLSFANGVTTELIVSFRNAFDFFLWQGGGIHPGVIFFIVLSGFCIHLPQAMGPDRLNALNFWRIYIIRRAIRIMPVFWLALFLGLISVWLTGDEYGVVKAQLVNSDVYFSIFCISEIVRFFGVVNLYPGNSPLTTVAVEVLLYASYPLFLFVHKRYGLSALIGLALLMYFGIACARMLGVDPTYLHGTWFEFVIYWIIGAVSAGVFAKGLIENKYALVKLSLIVVVGYLIYLVLISYVQIKGFHVVTTLLLALLTGGGLISLLIFESKLSMRQNRIAYAMALLGERSYSLYAVHTPVVFITLWFLSERTKIAIFSYPLVTLMMIFIATELMFRFVERPSHQSARQLR